MLVRWFASATQGTREGALEIHTRGPESSSASAGPLGALARRDAASLTRGGCGGTTWRMSSAADNETKAPQPGTSTEGGTAQMPSITVLVVEDEAEHQLLVRKALTREGTGFGLVQFARDSEEALRFANQMTFDVMLVDNRIPGTRGLDLLTALREAGSEAPFVLMTSAGSEDLVVEAWRQKVADYVIKDSGFWRDLPQVLRRVVEADRSRRREHDLVARLERTNARLDALRAQTDERAARLEALLGDARSAFEELSPAATGGEAARDRLNATLEAMAALFE